MIWEFQSNRNVFPESDLLNIEPSLPILFANKGGLKKLKICCGKKMKKLSEMKRFYSFYSHPW